MQPIVILYDIDVIQKKVKGPYSLISVLSEEIIKWGWKQLGCFRYIGS